MASIKDVAQRAGVSVSTVSRVISGKIPVDAGTAFKVKEAIRELDFHPNLLASGLRSKSGNLIGLLVPDILNESFALISKYTEEWATHHGFMLVVANTGNDANKEERFIQDLIRRHVDGIIFSRVSDQSRGFMMAEESKIPFVIIDRSLEREDVPSVIMDNYRSGVMAAEHLLSLGHHQLACITGPMDIAIVRERYVGFRDTVEKNGEELRSNCVFEGNFKFESGIEAIKKFEERKVRFTALWAHNDLMAIGAMNELWVRGVRVPQDVSLVGLDNISSSRMVTPALTTISQPFSEMCRAAVDLVVRMTRKEPVTELHVSLPPQMVVRGTTKSMSLRSGGSLDARMVARGW